MASNGPETSSEKTLRLLLRAEFADFRLSLFQELQTKLDAKADRLPFELLAKDMAELKASTIAREHLVVDTKAALDRVALLERAQQESAARERGIRSVFSLGKTAIVALFAAAIAVFDVVSRFFHH